MKNNDKNLFQSRGQFKVDAEIRSLQFVVHPHRSIYVNPALESYANDDHCTII